MPKYLLLLSLFLLRLLSSPQNPHISRTVLYSHPASSVHNDPSPPPHRPLLAHRSTIDSTLGQTEGHDTAHPLLEMRTDGASRSHSYRASSAHNNPSRHPPRARRSSIRSTLGQSGDHAFGRPRFRWLRRLRLEMRSDAATIASCPRLG